MKTFFSIHRTTWSLCRVAILSLYAVCFSSSAQQIINATVTVTNVAGTVNGQTITINGTARTWTNNVNSAQNQIALGTNVVFASSNLFTAYAIVPASGVIIHWNGTNSVNFQSYPGVAFTAALSANWGTVSFSTNTITAATVVRVPKAAVGLYEKTNVVNGLIDYLGDNSATSAIPVTAPAFANFVPTSAIQSTNYVNKIGTSIFPGSLMTNFWLDFGLTNAAGPVVYQTVTATNNVYFIGTTNAFQWGIISLNVIASGADRVVSLPTNWPHLNTNNLTLNGSAYQLTLTNGNEFRITLQSNVTLSTLWTTFGQGQSVAGSGGTNTAIGNYIIQPTNNATAPNGYIASKTGTNTSWIIPTTSGGSNSVVQSIFVSHLVPFGSAATYTPFFPLGSAFEYFFTYTAGFSITIGMDPSFWISSSVSQLETHLLIVHGDPTSGNIPLGFSNNQIFPGVAGFGVTPTNLAANQTYYFTIQHIGGRTNFLVNFTSVTNAAAIY